MKKPRTTQYTQEVLTKKGGSVVKKTIKLLLKQSASIAILPAKDSRLLQLLLFQLTILR